MTADVVLYLSVLFRTHFAPVAQLVEHLTFNQGVRSSILRRSTKKSHTLRCMAFFDALLRTEPVVCLANEEFAYRHRRYIANSEIFETIL